VNKNPAIHLRVTIAVSPFRLQETGKWRFDHNIGAPAVDDPWWSAMRGHWVY